MSDDFDILEFARQNWATSIRKRPVPAIDLPWINSDSENRPVFGLKSEVAPWRPSPFVYTPPPAVVIRNVRNISPAFLPPIFRTYQFPQPERPVVTLRNVRPFSRKSRTSSYWEDAGWKESDDSLIGHYRASMNRYKGLVELKNSDYEPFVFYIYDPPDELIEGRHSACFHRREPDYLNKYWIHFSVKPRDVDSGIIQVERQLTEVVSN